MIRKCKRDILIVGLDGKTRENIINYKFSSWINSTPTFVSPRVKEGFETPNLESSEMIDQKRFLYFDGSHANSIKTSIKGVSIPIAISRDDFECIPKESRFLQWLEFQVTSSDETKIMYCESIIQERGVSFPPFDT